jgi:hypothetical protein
VGGVNRVERRAGMGWSMASAVGFISIPGATLIMLMLLSMSAGSIRSVYADTRNFTLTVTSNQVSIAAGLMYNATTSTIRFPVRFFAPVKVMLRRSV